MNKFDFYGTGTKDILIISGIHGNEITPIYLSYLISKNDTSITSYCKPYYRKLTILNAVNFTGIVENTRELKYKTTSDLNRMFSNDVDINIKNELDKYLTKYDVIIDIHSSPNCKEFILINNDEYANAYVEFSEKNHIPYLLRYNSNDTIKKYCYENGKISFTLEINKINSIDFNSVSKGITLIRNLIIEIDNFKITKEEPKYKTYKELFTYKSGLFIPNFYLGDLIFGGGCNLGKIINIKNFEEYEYIYHGENIRLICDSGESYINANKSLYYVQPLNNI